MIDALCEELRTTCGLTRFSLVFDRRPIPLTISFEDRLHTGVPLAPTASLELQNALAADYSPSARASASAAATRYAPALRSALPA